MSAAPRVTPPKAWQQEVSEDWNDPVNPGCIGIAESIPPENILHMATDLGFNHLCQKQGHAFDKDLRSTTVLVENADTFLDLPIATILTPDDLSINSERSLICVDQQFNSSHQKRAVLDDMTKASQAKGFSQTIIDDIVLVADEMFTNAVFNAPFVDIETQKNPGVSRHSDVVTMGKGKFGRAFMAHDESRLIVGCQDPYGSLELKRYMNKIKASYVRGPAATMNFGPGGAGIGSYIIFNAGASLYFGVWPGRATVLCCVIPLGLSNRKRMQLPKHLHWFQR